MSDPTTPEGRAELVDTIDRALSMLAAAETIKKTGGAVEIAGVRIEPCDERGETLTLKAFADAAEARDRVRALHKRGTAHQVCQAEGCPCGNYITCLHCDEFSARGVSWPCDTIKALDGDS